MKSHERKSIIYEGMLKHYIYSTTVPVVTNLVRVVTYQKRILLVKSHDFDHMILKLKTFPLPMAIKFGRMVTYVDGSLAHNAT